MKTEAKNNEERAKAILDSQDITELNGKDGKAISRIRFGTEANFGPCPACGVAKGQFHILGCFLERCSDCGGLDPLDSCMK